MVRRLITTLVQAPLATQLLGVTALALAILFVQSQQQARFMQICG